MGRRHHQPVDGADHRSPADHGGKRHFGQTARPEQMRQPRIVQHRPRFVEKVRVIGPGQQRPVGGIMLRQMLQQPVQRGPARRCRRLVQPGLARQRLGPAQFRRRQHGSNGWRRGGMGRDPVRQRRGRHHPGLRRRRHRPRPVAEHQIHAAAIARRGPRRRHPFGDQVVPGRGRGLFVAVVPAQIPRRRHDQPALRPGHRHVQQPQRFLFFAGLAGIPGVGDQRRAGVGGGLPQRCPIRRHQHLVAFAAAVGGGVGQDHHRRLQPLGAVHRHHPDAVARRLCRALDLDLVGIQPHQKPGQRRHRLAFIGQCLRQHLVNPVQRLVACPRDQAAAAIMAGQDAFDHLVGAQKVGLCQQVVQHRQRVGPVACIAQRRPQRALARRCQPVQRGLGPAEQG